MGRPGLVGTAARTAVIAGTATAVSGSVAQKQAAKNAPPPQQAAPPPPVAAPAAAAPPAEDFDSVLAQLTKLGELRDAGVLDEAEFMVAKARLLSG